MHIQLNIYNPSRRPLHARSRLQGQSLCLPKIFVSPKKKLPSHGKRALLRAQKLAVQFQRIRKCIMPPWNGIMRGEGKSRIGDLCMIHCLYEERTNCPYHTWVHGEGSEAACVFAGHEWIKGMADYFIGKATNSALAFYSSSGRHSSSLPAPHHIEMISSTRTATICMLLPAAPNGGDIPCHQPYTLVGPAAG